MWSASFSLGKHTPKFQRRRSKRRGSSWTLLKFCILTPIRRQSTVAFARNFWRSVYSCLTRITVPDVGQACLQQPSCFAAGGAFNGINLFQNLFSIATLIDFSERFLVVTQPQHLDEIDIAEHQ
jgi:hypothetical protein